MNQVVVFENEGVIDVRSMKTFGVSAKEGENPIGYFGTGLKYAIAILIRTGQSVVVRAGVEDFVFGKKTITIRGKEFEVITMNDEEMPFTTELGKNWEPWQAFREIYCNCLDEGGHVRLVNFDEPQLMRDISNITQVFIKGSQSVLSYHERESIVLNMPSSMRLISGAVEVFNKPNKFFYYRGIRVFRVQPESLLTYNIIEESTLTEDRTLYNTALAIRKITYAITQLKDTELIKQILFEKEKFESKLDFSTVGYFGEEPSKEFEEFVSKQYELNSDKLNISARNWYANKKKKNALKVYVPSRMTDIEAVQLKKCIDICKKSLRGFVEYDLLVVESLGEQTHALAEIDQQRIVLSKKAFEMGTKYLLSTYIEEYSHIKSGFDDCTRQFQTHLFDSICTIIEDHVVKEPV